MDIRRKRRFQRLMYSPLAVIVLALTALWSFSSVWGVYVKDSRAEHERERAAEVAQELLERKTFLEHEIARLSTESGIEEAVRTKLGVAENGEHVIILIKPEGREAVATVASDGLWERIMRFFLRD